MILPKSIVARLSLLSLLCLFPLTAHASNNITTDNDLKRENNEESYYLLKDTDGTFDLMASGCLDVVKESRSQIEGIANCDLMAFMPDAFMPDNEELLDENFSEVVRSSAAVVPVTGIALLSTTAGSWGRYLYGVSKRAFTKWALSLAGGAVVVGYLAEKFAASEGVFLSSSTAGNNKGESLATSGGEGQLSPASPDPKPLPPPVVSTDTETHASYTEEDETPIFESMDDKAFKALLNRRNITADEYKQFEDAVTLYGIRHLHVQVPSWQKGWYKVAGTKQGEDKSDYFRQLLQNKGVYLSTDQRKEYLENQYMVDASYLLLTDVFKLIENRTLRQFQDLNLVKDGYALYTRPLMVNVAAQMPNILKEACASKELSHLDFFDCLEIYSNALLSDSEPFSKDSAVEPGKYLDSKYALKAFTTGQITDPVAMKAALRSMKVPVETYQAKGGETRFKTKTTVQSMVPSQNDGSKSSFNTASMKAALYSVMTSKVEGLEKVYVADVKRLLSMVTTFHNDLIWDFFKLPSENQISRVSRTRILEALVTKPSEYLEDRQKENFSTQKIYADPLFYEKSNCLKDNQMAVFGC